LESKRDWKGGVCGSWPKGGGEDGDLVGETRHIRAESRFVANDTKTLHAHSRVSCAHAKSARNIISTLCRTHDHSNAKDQDERLHWYRAPRIRRRLLRIYTLDRTSTSQLVPLPQAFLYHAGHGPRNLDPRLPKLHYVLFRLLILFASTVPAS
jgi:hypothetical protein